MSENSKGSPLLHFRHCDTVQKSYFKIFLGNFFQSLKGPPFNFFHILQPAGVSQSPKGPPFYIFRHCDTVQFVFFIFCHQLEFHKTQRVPPFTILSLRYSADFGRSRLVLVCIFFEIFFRKIFEYCKREYLTLGSLFAIFEPWIWRRLGPVPACFI